MNRLFRIALVGNPNTGKSTLFNGLTGDRQHVGNWPGKTVARKEGTFSVDGVTFHVVDLPGAYSLTAYSMEEAITRDYLIHECPDAVIAVVDAGNLERNLYLVVQLIELGVPLIVALNMADVAEARGLRVDINRLAAGLKVPVLATVATQGRGLDELKACVVGLLRDGRAPNRLGQTPQNGKNNNDSYHCPRCG